MALKIPLTLLIVSIALCKGGGLQAQDVDFGVKIGPNLSTVSGDLTENYEPRLGYHLGVFTEIDLSNRFSIKPEILYNSIGFILNISIEDFQDFAEPNLGETSFKSAQRANYLTVPLALKFNFNKQWGLEFGPQVAFLINSVSKLKEAQGFEGNTDRSSISGDFRLDFGPTLGVGYSFEEKIFLQLRYYHGLSDVFRNRIGNFKNYNRVLQLSFGYKVF